MILHALTLWPEWAWAVCHLGKDVENRPEQRRSETAEPTTNPTTETTP